MLLTPQTLRELRQRRGWTQRQLAEALCTHANTVQRWEAGQPIPAVKRRALERVFAEAAEATP